MQMPTVTITLHHECWQRHWSSCQKGSGETGRILLVHRALGLPIWYPDPTSVSCSCQHTEFRVSTTMPAQPIDVFWSSHHHFYFKRCANRCVIFLFKHLMCCGILKLVPRDSAGRHQESLVGVAEGSRVHMWQCVGKDEQRDPKWLSGCVCTHRRRGEDPRTILAWRIPASSMGVSGVSIFDRVNEQMCSRVKPTEGGKEDADFRAELWKRKVLLLSPLRGNPSNMVVHIL